MPPKNEKGFFNKPEERRPTLWGETTPGRQGLERARMKIVIPDDYEGNFTDSPQLARLMELGEVAHFTERPASEKEMAGRIADAEIILTVRYQTDFRNAALLDAARGLRFISVWGTRPRAVDMKRARRRSMIACAPIS